MQNKLAREWRFALINFPDNIFIYIIGVVIENRPEINTRLAILDASAGRGPEDTIKW